MKCQNCGHENDMEEKICEKCGTKIRGQGNQYSEEFQVILDVVVALVMDIRNGNSHPKR